MNDAVRGVELQARVRPRTDTEDGMTVARLVGSGILVLALLATVLSIGAAEPAAQPLGPATSDLLRIDPSPAGPVHDEVILYRGIHVRLGADGRIERRVRQVERLLTDHAVALRGDQRVAYDATRQELEVHLCRTFMRDGEEVVALPRAFNVTTPERVATCPDRTELQEMVISFLGVETGCLIELDYTVRDRVSWRPWLEGMEEVGAAAPVLEQEVSFDLPPGGSFHAAVIEKGAISSAGGESGERPKTLHWAALPAHPDEGGAPALLRIPQLVYSTCPSWDVLMGWLDERIVAAAVPDAAIKSWVGEDLPGGRLPLDATARMERIATLLGERTIKADDASLDWWLPVRSAGRTFDTSCGNLLDRSSLAMAAMSAMGADCRMVLRPATPYLVREVPALAQFDNIWLAVGPDFLDVAGAAFGPRPDPGLAESMLDRSSGKPVFMPLAPRMGSSFLSLHLRQGDDGSITGEAIACVGGSLVCEIDTSDLQGFLEGLAGRYAQRASVPGYEVRAFSPDTLAVSFTLTGAGLGDSIGGGRRRFEIPPGPGLPSGALPDGLSLRRMTRTTPIFLPRLVAEDVRVRLDLSAQALPLILPSSRSLAGGGASLETSVERDGGRIILKRRFETTKRTIEPEEYGVFRAALLGRTEAATSALYLTAPAGKP
jgi:hypothetical protein